MLLSARIFPVAMGMALGDKYGNRPNVTICMFGDGATNIGYFHEALNMSKVWDLPVLWVAKIIYMAWARL